MAKQQVREHTKETIDRATDLYFKIEQHFAQGGRALSLRDVNQMLDMPSSASAQMYVGILRNWKLITYEPKSVRTIMLAKNDRYPTVVYGTPTVHTEPVKFPRV